MIQMLNQDCMDLMRSLPDKAFELAIVDPEFGHFITPSSSSFLRTNRLDGIRNTLSINKGTDDAYFSELRRVSEKQIVWGGNYFFDSLGSTRGLIIWDKVIDGNTLLNWAEVAWQNVRQQTRIFRLHSTQREDVDQPRIHPNQKPVSLYRWLISNYAKPGDKILDTHGGSGSIAIACHDLGFDLTWTELDPDYYAAAVKRYEEHARQAFLFAPAPEPKPEQGALL